MKVVINTCHGGFNLSEAAWEMLLMKKGLSEDDRSYEPVDRTDPDLIWVVETLGSEVNGTLHGLNVSKLKVVEIPDDVEWEIQDYDGKEWIAEKHNTWG